MQRPSASTRLIALLGNPVSHSLSPAFQNAALDALRLDAVYVALACSEEALPGLLTGIARAGGAGNVTVPHKELAARLLERPSAAVESTGACNTFWLDEEGRICGDNTDVVGFTRALRTLLGGSPRGGRAVLIGAGGAAGAALYALLEEGTEQIVVVNRSPARAEALADRFDPERSRVRVITDREQLRGQHFDLAINATALGLHPGDPLPLDPDSGVRFDAAFDLVYSPEQTPWIRACLERSIRSSDGLEMLLQQGAVAFERWWGIDAPLAPMRAALPSR